MGRFDTIKTAIDANINNNGNQEITGSVLNAVLDQMVDATDKAMTDLSKETEGKLTELSAVINGVAQSSITTEGWTLVPLDKPIPQGATITEVVVENGTMPSDGTIYVQTSQGTEMSFKVSALPFLLTYDIVKMNIGNVRGAKVTLTWESPEGGVSKQISELSAEVSKVSEENENINSIAFNPFTRKGELFSEGIKKYNANANYDSSEFIEVASQVIGRMYLAPSNGNIKISFFSAEKEFISNFYGENTGLQKLNIVPPSDVAYMVLTTLHSYSNQSYIITDLYSVINEVEELGADIDGIKEKNEEVDATLDKIVPIIPQLDKLSVVASKNLLNPNDKDVLIGAYIYPSGDVQEYDTYNASGYIAVKPNTTYYKSIAANKETGFRFVTFYDADKKVIDGGLSAFANEFTTPTNCAYVRVSIYASSWAYAQVAETSMEYVPYATSLGLPSSILVDKERIATLNDISNPLYGKKWAVVGDSFTAEFANPPSDWKIEDGIYEGKSKVYGYLIANRNNMRLQWLGAGGKTMSTPASGGFTNAFSLDEYKNIDADVDYITIYLGINDSHHAPGSSGDDGEDKTGEIPLGTIDDTTNATFYGAWNVVIPYLLENHPFAHIGIIVSNGCDTDEYRVAEIAIAKKYGIPYIDLNGDARTSFMLRSTNVNIPTSVRNARTKAMSIDYEGGNLHPNKDAHEFQASFIETWMRSL
jgi:hypothetical protein